MLCQQCHEHNATIHLCQVVGGKMTKKDLCEVCGKEFVGLSKFGIVAGGPAQVLYDELLAHDSSYSKEAYAFVREGLDTAMKKHIRGSQTAPAHISGGELLKVLRELAIEKVGKAAKATLNGWGVFECEDFGEIVFNLVGAGLMAKTEKDSKADFQGGYGFDTAFPCD